MDETNARFLKATTTSIEKHSQTAKDAVGPLTLTQINWQPNPKVWSVGVVLNHLIVTNRSYLPVLKEIASGTYKMSFWARWSPFSQTLGRTMVKNLGPNPKRKYSSPPAFRPTLSKCDENILQQFLDSQQELLETMRKLESIDLGKIKIPSPASSFLTYSVWHAIRIIDVHEARHMQQISNLMGLPGYPTANLVSPAE